MVSTASPPPDQPGPGKQSYWGDRPRRIAIWRVAPSGDSHGPFFRVTFAGIWLVYLIPLVADAFKQHHGALYEGGAVALSVAFAAVYIPVVGWWDHKPRIMLPGFGVLFVLALLACILYGSGASTAWIYVAVAAGMTLGRHALAVRAIGLVAACYTFFALQGRHPLTTGGFLSGLLPLIFGGLAALGFRARHELTRELIRARETVALLAASEERLRLARDMHDLTGQSLSMITLKSQLAAKLLDKLPPSDEQARARDEVAQVADVSRQALADIREAISGYRRPTLAVEAITGRAALEAAGITAHDDSGLTLLSGTFDPDAEAALAWCLREAITNVVRHSGARHCWLTLRSHGGELVLEVRDDGRGVAAGSPGTAGPPEAGAGHAGLRGMAERLCAVGGRLEVRPGSGGFCLVATVPAGEPAPGGGPGPASQPTTRAR